MQEEIINKVDETLKDLVEISNKKAIEAKSKGFFSRDLAEACGVIISLAYGRWGKND